MQKLKVQIKDGLKQQLYFNQPCLDYKSDKKCNANEFFNEICHFIDLEELQKVESTCYYSSSMEYCPVLVKLGADRIKQAYDGANYLLQVWKTDKTKVYQRSLKTPIMNWQNCGDYFVYTLSSENNEEDEDLLYIVNLNQGNETVKIRNFGVKPESKNTHLQLNLVKHIQYANCVMLVSTGNEIEAIQIPKDAFDDETTLDADDLKTITISPDLNIHGTLINKDNSNHIIALETLDNQLDFNQLYLNFEEDSYTFEQLKEVQPRLIFNDPIKQVTQIQSLGIYYHVAVRQSGRFDIYVNLQKIESAEDLAQEKEKQNLSKGDVVQVQKDFRYVREVKASLSTFYFKMVDGSIYYINHKGKRNISFTESHKITDQELDYERIHLKTIHNIVNIFSGVVMRQINGLSYTCISHGKLVSKYDLFKLKWVNHVEYEDDIIKFFRCGTSTAWGEACLLLANGAFYVGVGYLEQDQTVSIDQREAKMNETIIRLSEDVENSYALYIVLQDINGAYKLKCFYDSKIQDIPINKPQANLSLTTIQIRNQNSQIILYNGNKLYLYVQKHDDGSIVFTQTHCFETDQISGFLQNATAVDLDKHVFLFDEQNMYFIKLKPDVVKKFPNIYCTGLKNFTRNCNYCICQETTNSQTPGLRIFDMDSVVRKEEHCMTLLKNIDIGSTGKFEFNGILDRFGFISSLSRCVLAPILHRNTHKLIGFPSLIYILCYKVVKDKIIILAKNGIIVSWNILTAKILSHVALDFEQLGIDGFECISIDKGSDIILRSQQVEHGINTDTFFMPSQLQTSTKNQKPYVKTISTDPRQHAILELKNENEALVHMRFIFPAQEGDQLYVNKTRDIMIQKLTGHRAFLFKAMIDNPVEPHNIRWQLIRQINDYPVYLANNDKRLDYFSPELDRYLVVDKEQKQFIVKDSISSQVIGKIPKDIMNCGEDEDPITVINRFLWLSTDAFIIISEDGFEKNINIDNNFKEVGYNYRPLFNEINGKEYLEKNYYKGRTGGGLKKKYQAYKSAYFLQNQRDQAKLYEELFAYDDQNMSYNNLSFTFFHWSIIDQLKSGSLKVDDIEPDVLEQILYNILPGGNTVLHKLCEKEEQLTRIFEVAHEEESQIKFHVPLIPNFDDLTAIHLSVEKKDFKSIDTILKYLKYYDIDHHSRAIKDLYPTFIIQNLPEFLNYVDNMFKQTQQLKAITKGCLKPDYPKILTSQLWFDSQYLQNKIMKTKPIETRIKCEILDMPQIYHQSDEKFHELYKALAETQQSSYFDKKAIQQMIEFNYPLVKEYITKRLFLPFCVFQTIFVFYMNVVYEQRDQPFFSFINYPLLGIIAILATYFLANETRQAIAEGLNYFKSGWNYIDIIPPIGIYILIAILILGDKDIHIPISLERGIQSIVTFFMWFKFLYFLRIYRATGYLISMIFEVVKDMRFFLLVLLITIIAFGDSLLSIAKANEDNQMADNLLGSVLYIYRMVLGDFSVDEFGTVATPLVYILFLLCTIFNMIVMLNLLIAIISDSYARVTSMAAQKVYQEMASLIAENSYLIPESRKKDYADEGIFLLSVTDLEEMSQSEEVNPVIDQFDALLKKQFEAKMNEFKKTVELIQKQNQDDKKDQDSKLGELIVQIIEQSNPVQKHVKIHANVLTKTTLKSLANAQNQYSSGFICSGYKFVECKAGVDAFRNDDEDIIHHCAQCKFDQCQQCFDAFGDVHLHGLEQLTYGELKSRGKGYQTGWGCDCRRFIGCPHGGKLITDPYTILYRDEETDFNCCEKCVITYKCK